EESAGSSPDHSWDARRHRALQGFRSARREADAARQGFRFRVPAELGARRDATGLRRNVHAPQARRTFRPLSRARSDRSPHDPLTVRDDLMPRTISIRPRTAAAALTAVAMTLAIVGGHAAEPHLTVDRVAAFPNLAGTLPTGLAWSPD